ncbi:MAG: porin family protein [Dysgonamonadaceae bacterium]|jgi:outer membrane protein X|nr:porin family protein [Dysgonamonadaceae bacterium]
MKKLFLLLSMTVCSLGIYAQIGDFYVGAAGGYITNYKDLLYGLNTSYHVSDPLEISLTGLMNPDITENDNTLPGDNNISKIKMYSLNLDAHFYMVLQRSWATGPLIGGQYTYLDKKYPNSVTNEKYDLNVAGFNLGWHLRINITDNIKINGGWRYTAANHNASHHLFYLGVGYNFNVF